MAQYRKKTPEEALQKFLDAYRLPEGSRRDYALSEAFAAAEDALETQEVSK